MKKKRINQILRGLGFDYNVNLQHWEFKEEEDNSKKSYSRYRNNNIVIVELKRPNVPMTKGKGGLNFHIIKGYENLFEKSLAQLSDEEFFSSMTRNFPRVKSLRRKDVLSDLLDNLED